MGLEYQLKFKFSSRSELDQVLRAVRNFDSFDEEYQLYNFRIQANKNTDLMPDAHVSFYEDRIIFCDNGVNQAGLIFEDLITQLIEKFGKVEIDLL